MSFQGQGCAIFTASASLIAEIVNGKTEAQTVDKINYYRNIKYSTTFETKFA